MGIFDRFLKKTVAKLSVSFQDNELIRFYEGYSLRKETILDVQPQQNVMISSRDKAGEVLIHSFVSEEGEYTLNKTIGKDTVDILFLNTKQRVKRHWLSAYQPSDQTLDQPLSGEYSISIENGSALILFLKDNYSSMTTHDDFIDQWISFSIDQVLITNSVNAKDIAESGDRLTSFLCQALQEDLTKHGLTLHKIKRKEAEVSAKSKIEFEGKAESIVVDSDPHPLCDDQKIYYRVKNGQQIGPYSSREIQQLIDQNDLSPNELLWRKGLSDWKSADSFDLFIWD